MQDITIVILTKNEESTIEFVIKELKKLSFQNILIADAGSEDNTLAIAKNYNIPYFIQKNTGYGAAILESLEKINTEYLSVIDADGSYDSNHIPEMLQILKNKNLDFVLGSRYLGGNKSDDDTIIRLIGNKVFTISCKFLFKLNITDILFHFPVCKTSKYKELGLEFKDFSICIEMPIMIKYKQFKFEEFFSKERKRIAGVSKVNAFTDGLKILSKMIKLYFEKRKKI